MRKGDIIETLTSVDIQEIVKLGGKVTKLFEVFLCKDNFETSPFRKVFEILFN